MTDSKRTRIQRQRQISTGESEPRKVSKLSSEAEKQIRALAKTTFVENKAANKHKREHDSARKKLLAILLEEKEHEVEFGVTIDGSKKTLVAKVESATSTGIDVRKLRKLVSEEQFMEIVSASMTAVKSVAGDEIASQCSYEKIGSTNVSVKEK